MNRTELIDKIASDAGITKAQAKGALDAFINATVESLRSGEGLSLVGFGSFKIADRAARMGMNPKTKEKIEIPATKVVRFKAGSMLQEAVKGK